VQDTTGRVVSSQGDGLYESKTYNRSVNDEEILSVINERVCIDDLEDTVRTDPMIGVQIRLEETRQPSYATYEEPIHTTL